MGGRTGCPKRVDKNLNPVDYFRGVPILREGGVKYLSGKD